MYIQGDAYGARLDATGKAHAFCDVMDVMNRVLPLPTQPLASQPPMSPEDVGSLLSADAEDSTIETLLGAWGCLRAYVGGTGGGDLAGERKFIRDFVLPAMRVQCTGLGID